MDFSLRAEHGYVAGVVAVSFLVHHMGLPISVMNARKKYGIKYPDLYASESNCKDANARKTFNCVQRGHQNALEREGAFLSLLMTAGLRFPVTAAVCGASYLVGRIVYQQGYATGNPDKRNISAPLMYPALLTLVGSICRFSYELLSKV